MKNHLIAKVLAASALLWPLTATADDAAPQKAEGTTLACPLPSLLSGRGDMGTTGLTFTITAEGTVSDVEVARSAGDLMLDRAAVRCARGWTFTPVMKDGKPAGSSWSAAISWHEIAERHINGVTLGAREVRSGTNRP
ncbi:MAG TPA: energy transducer TonB [Rhizomicrobium sp.]|jgi:TonB family protein